MSWKTVVRWQWFAIRDRLKRPSNYHHCGLNFVWFPSCTFSPRGVYHDPLTWQIDVNHRIIAGQDFGELPVAGGTDVTSCRNGVAPDAAGTALKQTWVWWRHGFTHFKDGVVMTFLPVYEPSVMFTAIYYILFLQQPWWYIGKIGCHQDEDAVMNRTSQLWSYWEEAVGGFIPHAVFW